MKPVLEARSISKQFPGVALLQEISLQVQAGESVAIIGKSGSGKSTLLHILGTLENPSQGEVFFPMAPGATVQEIRAKHIGFVFQSFELLEDYSLLENVALPGKIARMSWRKCYTRALELLTLMGLAEKKDLPTKLLSGGEKQRGALARALFHDPDIIFADEPTGNLDPVNAHIVQEMLFTSCEKYGKALVLVTHDADLAASCATRYELKEGMLRCL